MAIDGIGKIVTFVIELIPILAPLLLKYTCPSNLLLFLVYAILFISLTLTLSVCGGLCCTIE